MAGPVSHAMQGPIPSWTLCASFTLWPSASPHPWHTLRTGLHPQPQLTTKNCMEGRVSPSGSGSGAGGWGMGGCSGRTGPVTSSSSSSSSSVILMSRSSVYFFRFTCRFERRFWEGQDGGTGGRGEKLKSRGRLHRTGAVHARAAGTETPPTHTRVEVTLRGREQRPPAPQARGVAEPQGCRAASLPEA